MSMKVTMQITASNNNDKNTNAKNKIQKHNIITVSYNSNELGWRTIQYSQYKKP